MRSRRGRPCLVVESGRRAGEERWQGPGQHRASLRPGWSHTRQWAPAAQATGGVTSSVAACVTVIVCSATVSVPVRAAPGLTATVKLSGPLADPPFGGLIVIHGVVVVADHGVPECVERHIYTARPARADGTLNRRRTHGHAAGDEDVVAGCSCRTSTQVRMLPELNATKRPSALSAGHWLKRSPWTPSVVRLTRTVLPVTMSCTKTSMALLVSPDTRSVPDEANVTQRPSALSDTEEERRRCLCAPVAGDARPGRLAGHHVAHEDVR